MLGALGVFAAPLVALLGQIYFLDRLALPAGLAMGLAALAGVGVAIAFGFSAAAIGRRVGFYELALAVILLLGVLFGPVVWALPRIRNLGLAVSAWEAQGSIVLVLGLLSAAIVSGTAAFAGSALGFILLGSGRFDPSLSYELFVAKSHLRLAPRTLVGLFLLVVTGIVPGLLVALFWSFRRERRELLAAHGGELVVRPRMPATLLMTLISIGGVAIGVWALTTVLSVMGGFEGDLKAKILGSRSHGILTKGGKNDFTEWRRVREKVVGVAGVTGATPFLYSEVMISSGQNLAGSVLYGIAPDIVGTVSDLPRAIVEGKLEWLLHPEEIPPAPDLKRNGDRVFSDPGSDGRVEPPKGSVTSPSSGAKPKPIPGIILGREMARSLRLFVGDVVNVVSPFGDLGPAGPQPKSRPFRVAAISYTGMFEYDSKFAYIELGEAQRFLAAGDSVHGLEIKVADIDRARAVLRKALTVLDGYPYRVRDWGELNRNLLSALMMEKVVMAVILGFIVLVASFIIVATLIMQVLDKRREIAVLKSMGAGQSSIMKIFVAEGTIIGAVGTAFGLILGYGTCLLIDKVGIPLDPEVYYISNLPVRIDAMEFLFVALLALALSYLATIYPASKASRLAPVEGLRSE